MLWLTRARLYIMKVLILSIILFSLCIIVYFLLIIDNFITNFYNYDTRAEDIMGLHPGLVLGIPLERVVIIISLALNN